MNKSNILDVLFEKIGYVKINNKEYQGKTISIIVDGTKIDTFDNVDLEVQVNGNVSTLTTGSGSVIVVGDTNSVSTGSGSVKAVRIDNVNTGSGSVTCDNISGNVKTGSGSVNCKSMSGNINM